MLTPLYIIGLIIFIIIFLDCLDPITKKYNKLKNYFYQRNLPIKNNKLTKKYIKMLNNTNKNTKETKINETCSICLEEITLKDYKTKKILVSDCKHIFHTNCINDWVKTRITSGNKIDCPICRSNIIRNDEFKKYTHTTKMKFI